MATVSNPIQAFRSAVMTGTAAGQSANATIAFNITAEWEAFVPFVFDQPNTTALSAGMECYAYRSSDGGAAYDTVPATGFSVARAVAGIDQGSMRLETGQYLLRIITGGGSASTWSFSVGTPYIITAVNQV